MVYEVELGVKPQYCKVYLLYFIFYHELIVTNLLILYVYFIVEP